MPLGLESWLNPLQNDEQENTQVDKLLGGADIPPEPDTTCGGSIFNHDNVFHAYTHPITGQKLLYVSYWGAGLRIVDVTNPPVIPDPEELVGLKITKLVDGWDVRLMTLDGTDQKVVGTLE